MATPPTRKVARAYPQESISKSRIAKSAGITILSLIVTSILVYHLIWAINTVRFNRYGDVLSNVVFGFGTLIANGGVSLKVLTYINTKLIDDNIDADHKKYI